MKDKDQLFDALVKNGLDFLRRSTAEVKKDPGISIAHFAIGLELILKARLFHEHWSLISEKPHDANWGALKNGVMPTIRAHNLAPTLEGVTKTLLKSESEIFKKIFDHRNRVLHFLPSDKTTQVMAEQFRGWFYLRKLLLGKWKDVFRHHDAELGQLEGKFREYGGFLKVRFEGLTDEGAFKAAQRDGALDACSVCGFESRVFEVPDEVLSSAKCSVCESESQFANFGCGVWHDVADGLYEELKCSCNTEHSPQDLAELLDETPPLTPKEASISGDPRANCGECLQRRTVAQIGRELRCMGCDARFTLLDRRACDFCKDSWAGFDCADTFAVGCEHCDGAMGQH